MGNRKLFCEISPLTFKLSKFKCIVFRQIKDLLSGHAFSHRKVDYVLPVVIYKHNSLIHRRLGNVEMKLQENKAVNLSLAAPKVNGIIINPGEIFSFWNLVGADSEKNGYKKGLTISNGKPSEGIGGGLCQFTNLIHWMVLHSELTIVEHHHHDGIDLFPDFKRQIPFGTGTSIVYNYLDYRLKNNTQRTYQLLVWSDGEYLRGELRADKKQNYSYHIHAKNEYFTKENGAVFRNGTVYRDTFNKKTGECISREVLRQNHAKVMYDTTNLIIRSL